MSKTLTVLMLALTVGGAAMTALPAASATQCYTSVPALGYAARTCNYVFSGEAAREAGETVGFLVGEAGEIVAFLVDQYGDQLP